MALASLVLGVEGTVRSLNSEHGQAPGGLWTVPVLKDQVKGVGIWTPVVAVAVTEAVYEVSGVSAEEGANVNTVPVPSMLAVPVTGPALPCRATDVPLRTTGRSTVMESAPAHGTVPAPSAGAELSTWGAGPML